MEKDYKPTGANPIDSVEGWENFRWPTWKNIFTAVVLVSVVVGSFLLFEYLGTVAKVSGGLGVAAVESLSQLTFMEWMALIVAYFLWLILKKLTEIHRFLSNK